MFLLLPPVLVLLVLFSGLQRTQAQALPPPGPYPDDSARQALERARQAQEWFERLRRAHLPRALGWGSGPCDARAGRMCWRHQPLLSWSAPEEAPEVVAARDSLLRVLEGQARWAQGDPWILGQRVAYLLEAGRAREALSLTSASEENGPVWWRRALEGLVLHLQGRYARAGQAFEAALRAADPEMARQWRDPGTLLDGDSRELLHAAERDAPASREALLARFWHLSDPFFLIPGNDRFTEHLARHTLARIAADAENPHGLRWGNDMEELLVRYGRELSWARIPPRPGEMGGFRVVGYEHPDVRRFIPPGEAVADPTASDAAEWVADMGPFRRSGYAPAYAPVVLPMPSRLLSFTRGSHAMVAAVFRLPPDTTYRTRIGRRGPHMPPPALREWPQRSGMILVGWDPDSPRHATTLQNAAEGVLRMDVPAGKYLASVEALDLPGGLAGRHRQGFIVPEVPPDLPTLSELLVLEGETLPGDLQEALDRLSLDATHPAGEPLTLAWELWGLGWREETVRFRITAEPADVGLLDRFRNLFGGSDRYPILEWEEAAPAEPGPAFQSVTLSLPALEPGRYTLRLEVTLEGRRTLTSRDTIRVTVGRGDGEGILP